MEMLQAIARHGDDDRRIDRLGDRPQVARAPAGRLARERIDDAFGTRQRGLDRPLDHGQFRRSRPSGEDRPADGRRHQPGVEMPAGQSGDRADGPHPQRAGPRPEVLHPEPSFGHRREQSDADHGRIGARAGGRQGKSRGNQSHHRSIKTTSSGSIPRRPRGRVPGRSTASIREPEQGIEAAWPILNHRGGHPPVKLTATGHSSIRLASSTAGQVNPVERTAAIPEIAYFLHNQKKRPIPHWNRQLRRFTMRFRSHRRMIRPHMSFQSGLWEIVSMTNQRRRTGQLPGASAIAIAATIIAAAVLSARPIAAADHRDGPLLSGANTLTIGNLDLNDLYIFRGANPRNTVMILTAGPAVGVLAPPVFFPGGFYEFRIDNNGDAVDDLLIQVVFSDFDRFLRQSYEVRFFDIATGRSQLLARGITGRTTPLRGGGGVHAGIFDDPFFFNNGGYAFFRSTALGERALPPGMNPLSMLVPPAAPINGFGNFNTLAIVLEIPSSRLVSGPGDTDFAAWIRTLAPEGHQIDRTALPGINTAAVPTALQGLFNQLTPSDDPALRGGASDFLVQLYGIDQATADTLAMTVLPDLMPFDINSSDGVQRRPDPDAQRPKADRRRDRRRVQRPDRRGAGHRLRHQRLGLPDAVPVPRPAVAAVGGPLIGPRIDGNDNEDLLCATDGVLNLS